MKFKRIDWKEGEPITQCFDNDTVYVTGDKIVSGAEPGVFIIKRSTTKTLQPYTDPYTFQTSDVMCYKYTVSSIRNGKVCPPHYYYAP